MTLADSARESINSLSPDIIERIWKKLTRLEEDKQRRHLYYGCPYFVEEVGQYRITYELIESKKVIIVGFIGKHKDYDNWRKNIKE